MPDPYWGCKPPQNDPLKLERSLGEEIKALFWQTAKEKGTEDIVIVGKKRQGVFGLRAHVRPEMIARLDAELPPEGRDWYRRIRKSAAEDSPEPWGVPIWIMMEKTDEGERVLVQLSVFRIQRKNDPQTV